MKSDKRVKFEDDPKGKEMIDLKALREEAWRKTNSKTKLYGEKHGSDYYQTK